MSLSTVQSSSRTLSFSNLPQEILSEYIMSFIEYSEAAKISRVSRAFLDAFMMNEYHARMKESLREGTGQLATLVKDTIEAFPISMCMHHKNGRDDEDENTRQQKVAFRLNQVFGDKIDISILDIQLVPNQPLTNKYQTIFRVKNPQDIESNTFQINIKAVYQSALLLRLPEMMLKKSNKLLDDMAEMIENGTMESSSDITEWVIRFGKSTISIFGALALIPIYALSSTTVALIKRRFSKLTLLSNCKLTMQQEGKFSSQGEEDYIRLCIRKLNHHEFFKPLK